MKIEKRELRRGLWRLSLQGKLTIDGSEGFEAAFQSLLRPGCNTILMDLSVLDFIDSSGIGILMNCANLARSGGVDLHLYGLQDQIMNVFRGARIDTFFSIQSPEGIQALMDQELKPSS
ncbi:MAG: STAS domain-containing protein [Spirochaetes bacterium]|nr:STAS domain-containing protein [Spirochaetota bacterium]